MRCGAWVFWKTVGKKKLKKKPAVIISMYNHYVYNFPLTDNPPKGVHQRYKEEDLEKCDGEVEVSVRVGIDGGCACCGSVDFEIEYKCKKCGNMHFEELPRDEESLSAFLNGIFNGLDELIRFNWIADAKAKKEKQDAVMQKAVEKMQREIEQSREAARKKRQERLKRKKK